MAAVVRLVTAERRYGNSSWVHSTTANRFSSSVEASVSKMPVTDANRSKGFGLSAADAICTLSVTKLTRSFSTARRTLREKVGFKSSLPSCGRTLLSLKDISSARIPLRTIFVLFMARSLRF